MTIQSLGYRTDLFFPAFDGEILDRGEYLVIRTPSNPTFYWGNFLLFSQPPGEGDYDRWRQLFAQEIGTPPATRHFAFGWDTIAGERGELAPFIKAGFDVEESVVLTARNVHAPPKVNHEIIARALIHDWEWDAALQNQIACRSEQYSLTGYTPYKTRQMARYRAMANTGLGTWFGAFLGNTLAADLGVYVRDGVGRFQSVGTHPDYRRRGICGTLVYEAARYAFGQLGAETLVMIADENYHAAKIYESAGFQPTEHLVTVEWWER